jgi:uncharacterized protein (TIGR03086 family)
LTEVAAAHRIVVVSDWPEDPAERHRVAAAAFGGRVRGVRDWSVPAPPEGWDARDVVLHLLEWLPGLLSSSLGVELPDVDTDGDLAAAWEQRTTDVDRLLGTDGDRPYESELFGQMTLADVVDRFYTNDVVMHTWDLARATGQDDRLPRTFCEQSFAGMEPMADVLSSSGQFGPRVPVPDDADVQDRLIGLIGRDPSWRPPG